MAIKKKKISEFPLAHSLKGLYTIGVGKNNQSTKVSLEFVQDAANSANEATASANEAIASLTIIDGGGAESLLLNINNIHHG